jgi:cation transport ATPase
MNKVHYNVDGLINTTMKTQVKSVLEELEGVQQVYVNNAQGTVDVDFNNPTVESEIRERIEHVGCKIQ